MTDSFRTKVLNDHNTLRRTLVTASNMIELTWDSNLETVAQNFVNAATSGGHNNARTAEYAALGGSGYVGENYYSGSPSDAAEKWATFVWPTAWGGNDCSEQQNYWANYEASTNGQSYQSCAGGTVGHYTQVLWANSARLGCGYTSAIGTICNYAPGGNVGGYTNYVQSGAACSACPSGYDVCVNGLCSSGSAAPSWAATPTPTTPTTSAPTDATDTTTPNPTASPTSISPTLAPSEAPSLVITQTVLIDSSTWDAHAQLSFREAIAKMLTNGTSLTVAADNVTILTESSTSQVLAAVAESKQKVQRGLASLVETVVSESDSGSTSVRYQVELANVDSAEASSVATYLDTSSSAGTLCDAYGVECDSQCDCTNSEVTSSAKVDAGTSAPTTSSATQTQSACLALQFGFAAMVLIANH